MTTRPLAASIAAKDGYSLSASVYGDSNASLVIIFSATGVPRNYYDPFARWLSESGHRVITFDYRGIGDSIPPARTLRGFQASMLDWATLDSAGVLDWATENYPDARVSVIGHSFGGQCVGLLANHAKIDRMVLVAAQDGYWRAFNPEDQPKLFLLWYVIGPILSRVLGYFPSKLFGLGEDLPKGVMLQWAKWCRQESYLFADLGPQASGYFDQIRGDILAYRVMDDHYAPPRSVKRLLARFIHARFHVRTLAPSDLGVRRIGHFGPFRKEFSQTIWNEIRTWISSDRFSTSSDKIALGPSHF